MQTFTSTRAAQLRDIQRRTARAKRRAIKYGGAIHWETLWRLSDLLNQTRVRS